MPEAYNKVKADHKIPSGLTFDELYQLYEAV